jgi:hypothetical protein
MSSFLSLRGVVVLFFLSLHIQLARADAPPRGPIRLEDRFTLSISRLTFSPDSARIIEARKTRLRTSFSASNTINRKGRSFLIDSEDRDLTLELTHGLSESVEIGLSVPIIWRGGGVLDSAIFEWHSLFGLPQGPRDDADIEDNEYTVTGLTDEGDRFSIASKGVRLGDIRTRIKYQLFDKPLISSALELKLPTGSSAYGSTGVDLLASLHMEQRYMDFAFHSAIAYSFYGAPDNDQIRYQRHRAYSALHIEYMPYQSLSLLVGLILNSNLVQDIERFPNYQLYLDLGFKFAVSDSIEVEFLIRENPAPDQGSSDITGHLGTSIIF